MPRDESSPILDQKKAIRVQSPGRINLIGEHTDYNDGFVLPAAIDKKTIMQVERNESSAQVCITASNIEESFSFDLRKFSPLNGGWPNYFMGVVNEFQKLGAELRGFNAEFEGDVPIGSGMSSSASLECSFAFALNKLFNLGFDTRQLIRISQMAEHHFVGIKCGIMDQFASMMGKKDRVILLDCRSMEYQYFPIELDDYQILLLNTNVSHTLASSEYNTRRQECETGSAILREAIPYVVNLRDVSYEQLLEYGSKMPQNIFRRCNHVISENQRVLKATRALVNRDHQLLGKLMYESHFSLQKDYEVSCPELDFLVQQTLDRPYVLGSRMMGGGFGGCTINILAKQHLEVFVEQISKSYHQQFGIELTPYTITIENGTAELVD